MYYLIFNVQSFYFFFAAPILIYRNFVVIMLKIVLEFEANEYNLYMQEVMRAPSKKVSRIFVARVLPSVTEAEFRRYSLPAIFSIQISSKLFICYIRHV